jgi:hypothetical protein
MWLKQLASVMGLMAMAPALHVPIDNLPGFEAAMGRATHSGRTQSKRTVAMDQRAAAKRRAKVRAKKLGQA